MTFTKNMMTMMAMTFMISPVHAFFGLPDNVDFVTYMYNTSNCSNTSSYRNITLNHFCYDTQIFDGYPKCCNDLLSEISLFENATFRQCMKTNMTFTNLSGVSYDCNVTHMKHLGTAGTLSYIGLISMLVLAIGICGWIMWKICGGRRSYDRM